MKKLFTKWLSAILIVAILLPCAAIAEDTTVDVTSDVETSSIDVVDEAASGDDAATPEESEATPAPEGETGDEGEEALASNGAEPLADQSGDNDTPDAERENADDAGDSDASDEEIVAGSVDDSVAEEDFVALPGEESADEALFYYFEEELESVSSEAMNSVEDGNLTSNTIVVDSLSYPEGGTITVKVGNADAVEVKGGETFTAEQNTEITLTAIPNEGYRLLSGGIYTYNPGANGTRENARYSDADGQNVYTHDSNPAPTFTFTKSDKVDKVGVRFEPITNYTVEVRKDDETVVGTYSLNENSERFTIKEGEYNFIYPNDLHPFEPVPDGQVEYFYDKFKNPQGPAGNMFPVTENSAICYIMLFTQDNNPGGEGGSGDPRPEGAYDIQNTSNVPPEGKFDDTSYSIQAYVNNQAAYYAVPGTKVEIRITKGSQFSFNELKAYSCVSQEGDPANGTELTLTKKDELTYTVDMPEGILRFSLSYGSGGPGGSGDPRPEGAYDIQNTSNVPPEGKFTDTSYSIQAYVNNQAAYYAVPGTKVEIRITKGSQFSFNELKAYSCVSQEGDPANGTELTLTKKDELTYTVDMPEGILRFSLSYGSGGPSGPSQPAGNHISNYSNNSSDAAMLVTAQSQTEFAEAGAQVSVNVEWGTGIEVYGLNVYSYGPNGQTSYQTTKQDEHTYTFTMPATSVYLQAISAVPQSMGDHTITIKQSEHGVFFIGSEPGPAITTRYTSANAGQAMNLHAYPEAGYKVGNLIRTLADGTVMNLYDDNMLTMPDSDVTYSILFVKDSVVIDTPRVYGLEANKLTYNGEEQNLIAYTNVVGGDIKFSTDNQNWTDEMPKGKGVGEYQVYIRVIGNKDEGFVDYISDEPLIATIAPKEVGLEWSNTTQTYDNSPKKPTVVATGLVSGETFNLVVEGEWTDAGEYTATAKAAEETSANYKVPDDNTVKFTIEKASSRDLEPVAVSVSYKGTDTDEGMDKKELEASLKDAEGWSVQSVEGMLITTASFDAGSTELKYIAAKASPGVTNGSVIVNVTYKNYQDTLLTVNFTTGAQHTLSFNSNGGNPVPSRLLYEGEKIENLPGEDAMTKAGYKFVGWKDVPAKMGDEDKKLVAEWEEETYTITLNLGDEKLELSEDKKPKLPESYKPDGVTINGNELSYNLNTPAFDLPVLADIKKGDKTLTFDGWVKSGDEETEKFINVSIDTSAPENLEYTAMWSEVQLEGKVSIEGVTDKTGIMGLVGTNEDGEASTGDDATSSKLAEAMKEIASQESAQMTEGTEPSEDTEQPAEVQKVAVSMNLAVKSKDEVDDDITNVVGKADKAEDPEQVVTEYIEIEVTKTIGDAEEGVLLSDLNRVVEIPLIYNLTGRFNPAVFRQHTYNDGENKKTETIALRELTSRPKANQYKDGTFYISGSGEKATIYIYSQYFSTFAVYTNADETFKVSFDANGGAWKTEATGTSEATSQTVQSMIVKKDHSVTEPASPTREADEDYVYDFNGWKTETGDTYQFTEGVTDKLSLFADWKAKPIVDIKINNGDDTFSTAYNGLPQSFDVDVAGSNIEISYSTEKNGEYSTAKPSFTNAMAAKTIYWKAEPQDDSCVPSVKFGSLTFAITQADSAYTIEPKAVENLVYTGSEQALVTEGAVEEGQGTIQYKLDNGKYSADIPKAKDAGEYEVFYKIEGESEGNYSGKAETSITVIIAKADLTATDITKKPTANKLTANGKAQALVTAGAANNGTMQYKLGNGAYSATIPTATEAGDYTVYYKVAGDKNHNDLVDEARFKLTVTIAKAAETPTKAPETPTVMPAPAAPAATEAPVEVQAPAAVEPTGGPGIKTILSTKKSTKATVLVGEVYQIDLAGKTGKGYKSSKKGIATVSSTGLVTPRKAGKVKITFKVGKKKRTITLKVQDPTVPKSIALDLSGTVAAKVGEQQTLTVTLPDGTNSAIKWKTSNKKIATVSNGVVTFKKAGTVTITATATRGKKKAKVKFKVSK